jgi:uncharacterized heparinase superfamily protein
VRLSELGRLWRTLRHLEPIQVIGRTRLLIRHPLPNLAAAPPLRPAAGPWRQPAAREPSMTGPATLRFLSEEHSLDACGWDRSDVERLWRYNLHYFDDLNAEHAAQRAPWHRALVERWIAENPPPVGTAWEPYPVSLRIVNWIKWYLGGEPARAPWLHSLAVQARWLRRRLEWHLLGNHLFANAKALVFAGLYFDGNEADDWIAAGQRILARQLPEQILADGGHFERSTMYHALALEDLLDLLNLIAARGDGEGRLRALSEDLHRRAGAMLHWLRCMSHPDGELSLFNDAAAGIAPARAELEAYAARLGVVAAEPPAQGLTDLPASGYVRAARGPAVAFLDLAPLGPDYLVGHGHADTLAFELSLHGRRMIVNGGTSCYGLSAQRLRERGTAWHSTVQVDNADSSEVWSGFRVGRRARVLMRRIDGWTVAGTHDGWRALPGAPRHERRWSFDSDCLVVDDRLQPAARPAVARYHLAPGLALGAAGERRWTVTAPEGPLADVFVEAGEAAVKPSQHAPRFGVLLPAQALVVALHDGQARTRWVWRTDAHPLSH